MRECLRCGNFVTEDYHRVYCNNDGELWSCLKCTPDGETLTSPDEESRSRRYEENLDKIRRGGSYPQSGDRG